MNIFTADAWLSCNLQLGKRFLKTDAPPVESTDLQLGQPYTGGMFHSSYGLGQSFDLSRDRLYSLDADRYTIIDMTPIKPNASFLNDQETVIIEIDNDKSIWGQVKQFFNKLFDNNYCMQYPGSYKCIPEYNPSPYSQPQK